MKHLLHLASRIYNTPLLIDRAKLEIILGVLGPRIGWEDGTPSNPDQETDEERLRNKPYEVSPEGIAILDIQGTLVNRASGLDALSGLRSYSSIQNDLEDAYTDPGIKAILLRIDSHGGEVAGAFDLADLIAECGKKKKIWAVADDNALSAGYLLASQASRVYVSRTGAVGSVGVLAIHVDQSGLDKQEGLKYTTIFAGEHKNDLSPHEPLSKSAAANVQAEVDRLYAMFISTVARGRRMTADQVAATEAQVYFGENALPVHFADRVGTFSDALKDLTEAATPAPVPTKTASLGGGIFGAKKGDITMPAIERHNTEIKDGGKEAPPLKPEGEEVEVKDPVSPDVSPAVPPPVPDPVVEPEPKAEGKDPVTPVIMAPLSPAVPSTIDEARDLGYSKAYSEFEEVKFLCGLAGQPDSVALSFICNKTPLEKVREELLKLRASASDSNPIRSMILPESGTGTGGDPKNSPVVKAAENIAAEISASATRMKGR